MICLKTRVTAKEKAAVIFARSIEQAVPVAIAQTNQSAITAQKVTGECGESKSSDPGQPGKEEITVIKMDIWGKDHWSLLAYCAWAAIDYKGVLEVHRMRADGIKYPTVLKNGVQKHYNDFDCLDDLESEGLIKNVGTGINPSVVITDKGWNYVLKLFKHKAAGGSFSNLAMNEESEAQRALADPLAEKICNSCDNRGWETMNKVAACNCCEGHEFYTPQKQD